jgi:hypothetical protein
MVMLDVKILKKIDKLLARGHGIHYSIAKTVIKERVEKDEWGDISIKVIPDMERYFEYKEYYKSLDS